MAGADQDLRAVDRVDREVAQRDHAVVDRADRPGSSTAEVVDQAGGLAVGVDPEEVGRVAAEEGLVELVGRRAGPDRVGDGGPAGLVGGDPRADPVVGVDGVLDVAVPDALA